MASNEVLLGNLEETSPKISHSCNFIGWKNVISLLIGPLFNVTSLLIGPLFLTIMNSIHLSPLRSGSESKREHFIGRNLDMTPKLLVNKNQKRDGVYFHKCYWRARRNL